MDFSKARVGDRLYSLRVGWVRLVRIARKAERPVRGETEEGGLYDSWTFNGKRNAGDVDTDLYWSKPKITGGDEEPKRTKKIKKRFAVFQKRGCFCLVEECCGHPSDFGGATFLENSSQEIEIEIEIPDER